MVEAFWIDDVARGMLDWGPPGCVLCDEPDAERVGTEYVCRSRVCRTLIRQVRTFGDLGAARLAIASTREAA